MSGRKIQSILLFAALGALIASAFGVGAETWPRPEDAGVPVQIRLSSLQESPKGMVGRNVRFVCRFSMVGSLFRHSKGYFTEGHHVNFAAWPLEAKLWTEEDRRAVVPSLYVEAGSALGDQVRSMRRYDAVEVTGTVMSDYANMPWILVQSISPLDPRTSALTGEAILCIRKGVDFLQKGHPVAAAACFDEALVSGCSGHSAEFVRAQIAQCRSSEMAVAREQDHVRQQTLVEQEAAGITALAPQREHVERSRPVSQAQRTMDELAGSVVAPQAEEIPFNAGPVSELMSDPELMALERELSDVQTAYSEALDWPLPAEDDPIGLPRLDESVEPMPVIDHSEAAPEPTGRVVIDLETSTAEPDGPTPPGLPVWAR